MHFFQATNFRKSSSYNFKRNEQRFVIYFVDYKFKYKPGNEQENADALSRLPLQNTVKDMDREFEEHIRLLELDNIPITADDIRNSSKRDSNIVKTMQLINNDCWEGYITVIRTL